MDRELFEKIKFFCKDNKIQRAAYKDKHLYLELYTVDENKKYGEMVDGTIEKIRQLSQVDVSFKDSSKKAEVEKLMAAEFSTIYYNFNGNVVQLYATSYDILQQAKYRVEIVVGNKQENTGRRGRRFADPSENYTRSKDNSHSGDKQPYASSQSFSQTAGGATPAMEQVYTTTEGMIVKVYVGNILKLDVDCIVNAANENLMHGGGVAQVISAAAGYRFDQESDDYVQRYGPLSVGTCCSTSAGNLTYKNVIHTVGPKWYDYKGHEKNRCALDLLQAIICCFDEAEKLHMKSIALPSISAGIFGVPKEICVAEYKNAILEFSRTAKKGSCLKEIHFIDKDFGLISLIQNEFGKTFNLSQHEGSGRIATGGKPPDLLSRSMSTGSSTTRGSSGDIQPGTSVGGSRSGRSFSKSVQEKTGVFIIKQKVKVEIKIGDITQCEVDSIVCPQDEWLSNKGAIARKISEIAGHEYKTDVSKLVKVNQTGARRINAPRKCPWKYVIQTVPPRWNIEAQRENQKFEKKLKETIVNILKATKSSRIKTLAMPLMGIAEKGDTPVKTFGEQFVNALLQLIWDKDLTVEEIHILVYDVGTAATIIDVFQTFEDKGIQKVRNSVHRKPGSKSEEPTNQKLSVDEGHGKECCICIDKVTNPKKLPCGHIFCTECIDKQFKYKPSCPQCGATHGVIKGTQPAGKIRISTNATRLTGHWDVGTIVIEYEIYSGIQKQEHPSPGKYYEGIKRTAYLPDTKKGRMISKLLQIAFDRRLVFTIGTSTTTGKTGVVTWNDIHHKTNPNPNTQFGYPDATYLDRVLEELATKGVTKKDLKD